LAGFCPHFSAFTACGRLLSLAAFVDRAEIVDMPNTIVAAANAAHQLLLTGLTKSSVTALPSSEIEPSIAAKLSETR